MIVNEYCVFYKIVILWNKKFFIKSTKKKRINFFTNDCFEDILIQSYNEIIIYVSTI